MQFLLFFVSDSMAADKPTQIPVKAITVSTSEPEVSSSSSVAENNNADYCVYKGRKYAINERIENGCESICKCMAATATVECEPRCPKPNQTTEMREQCVSVPDPKDSCCRIELCDVTLDDHEQGAISIVPAPTSLVDAMKHRKATNANRTTNEMNNNNSHNEHTPSNMSDDEDDAAGDKHDSNGKYDCEHNGNKYKIGNARKRAHANANRHFSIIL